MARNYRFFSRAGLLCLAATLFQGPRALAQAPADATPVIKSEVRLVIVNTVVTDRKGGYVHDLTEKNFRVLEDGKEQTIKSFSFEADAAAQSKGQPHYLVLFFDNSTIDFAMQHYAREAAAKFIDTNAGPNRLMAIVNFTGQLQIAQNFTPDADRLKRVVSGVKFATTAPNGDTSSVGPSPVNMTPTGGISLGQAERSSAWNPSSWHCGPWPRIWPRCPAARA